MQGGATAADKFDHIFCELHNNLKIHLLQPKWPSNEGVRDDLLKCIVKLKEHSLIFRDPPTLEQLLDLVEEREVRLRTVT